MRLPLLFVMTLTFSTALADDPQPEVKKNKSAQSSQKCTIKKCDFRYNLDSTVCECREWAGPTCRIQCPEGTKIFALPWIVNCKCEKAPECAIEECREDAELAGCKCARKKATAKTAEKKQTQKETAEDGVKDE